MPTTTYTYMDGELVSENRAGTKRDYVPDPLGSTVVLLDNTQTKTDTFGYWPFGEVASRTGTTATPYQFVGTLGCYRDSAARIAMDFRVLNTAQGRWQTEDPIGFGGNDWNLYRYVQNNPTTLDDIYGLQKQKKPPNKKPGTGKKPGSGVQTPKCKPEDIKSIKIALEDLCKNRLQYITNPKTRECIRKKCNNIIIECHYDYGGGCASPGPGRYTCAFTQGPLPTNKINLCPPSLPSSGLANNSANHCRCLGGELVHEMTHACGAKTEVEPRLNQGSCYFYDRDKEMPPIDCPR